MTCSNVLCLFCVALPVSNNKLLCQCAKDGQRLQKRAGGCIGGLREDTPCMVLMVPFRSRPNGDWDALMDWVGFMRNFFAERPQVI